MPIAIQKSSDPLSEEALAGRGAIIVAQSDAGRILRQELERYCAGEIQGRSFLIAGHRGAGKTLMVAEAIARATLSANPLGTRVLPVFLHGPSLFESIAVARAPTAPTKPAGSATESKPESAGQSGAESEGRTGTAADVEAEDIEALDADAPATPEDAAQRAIVQVILGLHRSVVKEFVSRYRQRVLLRTTNPPADSRRRSDLGELAAQFEIELLEDPPAIRLREFWMHAGALDTGVLFGGTRETGQGTRELVALNGICSAHQRISGDLKKKAKGSDSQDTTSERTSALSVSPAEAWKPIASVASGAAVAGGTAAGSHSIVVASILGLATALLSSMSLSGSSKSTRKRQRQVDTTFIPDLTLRTLDRVLPVLLDRLRGAGLAPVLIIDELDKVHQLSGRIEAIIHCLKKLMAENVFSCFITDRGYLEYLRIYGGGKAYGVTYSYFSHALLVSFQPGDIDEYLTRLLKLTPPAETAPAAVSDKPEANEDIDLQLLRWVLRHRSQLHALELNRQIALLRGDNDELRVDKSAPRSSYPYLIDVTFQVAIELQLYQPHILGWRLQRAGMSQILYDALYYLSRKWLEGQEAIQVPRATDEEIPTEGDEQFKTYLNSRMNLDEVCSVPGRGAPEPLSASDLRILRNIVLGIVKFLSQDNTLEKVQTVWKNLQPSHPGTRQIGVPSPIVMSALRLGEQSLIVRQPSSLRANAYEYRWRYWPSGMNRDLTELSEAVIGRLMSEAKVSAQFIASVEVNLWKVFRRVADPVSPDGVVFTLLSDHYWVLKTSPAWPQVRNAMANVRSLEEGGGNRGALPDDCRTLSGFVQALSESAEVIRIVLANASFLAGIGSNQQLPDALRQGLGTLSAGLRFFERGPGDVQIVVQEFQDAVESHLPSTFVGKLSEPAAGGELQSDAFIEYLRSARDAGVGVGDHLKWDDIVGSAWGELRLRLLDHARAKPERRAELREILCAMRRVGPGAHVGLNLGAMTLSHWSTAFLAAIDLEAAKAGEPNPVPVWIGAFCLKQLGVDGLNSAGQTLLHSMLTETEIAKREKEPLVDLTIATEALWRSGASPGDAVGIVIRKGRYSVTNDWKRSSELGLLFILTSSQVEGFVTKHLPLLCRASVEKPRLFWEQPPDSPAEQQRLRARFDGMKGHEATSVMLYPSVSPNNDRPSVVAFTGPDDLLIKSPVTVE